MVSRHTSETSSRSSTSDETGPEEVRTHSAVHVLRGAVTAALGPQTVREEREGSVLIGYERELTPQLISEIEAAANTKISEDLEFLEFEMERAEAEGHFGKGIYDLETPAEDAPSSLVRVVRIPEWDTSVCSRRHTETTGEIGAIKLGEATLDAGRKQVRLDFSLVG
jgi:alanyl-tRNA synthetase